LSGFADAEGTFTVQVTKRSSSSTGYAVEARFMLDQNDELILKKIKSLFNFGNVYHRKSTRATFRYQSTGSNNMLKISNYFTKFTLRTNKLQSFIKWLSIVYQLLDKKHLTTAGLNKIIIDKKLINLKNSKLRKTGKATK
jgi:hypothetical protein